MLWKGVQISHILSLIYQPCIYDLLLDKVYNFLCRVYRFLECEFLQKIRQLLPRIEKESGRSGRFSLSYISIVKKYISLGA